MVLMASGLVRAQEHQDGGEAKWYFPDLPKALGIDKSSLVRASRVLRREGPGEAALIRA
jgi:hypothetical protein